MVLHSIPLGEVILLVDRGNVGGAFKRCDYLLDWT